MLAGVIWDAKKIISKGCYMEGDKNKLSSTALMKLEAISDYLGSSKLYLLGPRVCYVDFYLFELLQLVDFISNGAIYLQYPNFETYQVRVSKLPRLKEFLLGARLPPFNTNHAIINNRSPERKRSPERTQQQTP